MILIALVWAASTAVAGGRDVQFFVLVKSSNYSQAKNGNLTLLNYHFFSEIFPKSDGRILEARLYRQGNSRAVFEFQDRGANFYFEGGHFDSLGAVDAAYPNGVYQFAIGTAGQSEIRTQLKLSGPEGKTDIPEPIQIGLSQAGQSVSPVALDSSQDLVIGWSDYTNGRDDPRGIVDDMIFVVVSDCFGERIYHTGLPFGDDPYLRHDVREVRVSADLLWPGEPYSMFVEFPHVVDSVVVARTPGFASFATATYLDLETSGSSSRRCPDVQPPMDTGQTDRMDIEQPHGTSGDD